MKVDKRHGPTPMLRLNGHDRQAATEGHGAVRVKVAGWFSRYDSDSLGISEGDPLGFNVTSE